MFDKELANIEELKTQLTPEDQTFYSLEDVEYMEKQIKKSLEGLEYVMNKLEEEIKTGTKASMFEV